jgi:hypothetical protein
MIPIGVDVREGTSSAMGKCALEYRTHFAGILAGFVS